MAWEPALYRGLIVRSHCATALCNRIVRSCCATALCDRIVQSHCATVAGRPALGVEAVVLRELVGGVAASKSAGPHQALVRQARVASLEGAVVATRVDQRDAIENDYATRAGTVR